MKILACFILTGLALLFSCPAIGQKGEGKKSVYKELKSKSSRSSIDQLLSEAEMLREDSPKLALERVKEALAMSIASQNVMAESRSYNLLGQINLDIHEYRLALENFRTAKDKMSSSKAVDIPEYGRSLRGIGLSLLNLGNHGEALSTFNEISRLNLPGETMAHNAINISEAHYRMGNYQKALDALQPLEGNRALNETLQLSVENQKVKIYARMNEVEKATSILESSQARSRANRSAAAAKPEASSMDAAKEELSDALYEQNRYDDEIALRNNSIDYNLDVQNLGEVSRDKVALSKALVAKGETRAAIRELQEAATIADTINDPKKQAVAYLSLASLYEKYGDPGAAIDNYKKYSRAVEKSESKNEEALAEKSTLIRTQRDIEELSKYVEVQKEQENLALAMVSRQRVIIYGLLLIIGIIAITSYFIYKNAVASRTANQLLALKSLRSQMNPHFIFNALNSVNHFVSQNDERSTNKFLSEFSRLMRLVLENSQEDFIPLYKEEEIIALYLKLEHYRFRDKFDYEIVMDGSVNKESVQIPPMLIQPYIENAVWHGLRYKESKGFLSVRFHIEQDNLLVSVEDNGIGRKRSAELKTENQKKHISTGLKNIRERLGIINKVYKCGYRVEIDDLEHDSGTRVKVFVPLHSKTKHDA